MDRRLRQGEDCWQVRAFRYDQGFSTMVDRIASGHISFNRCNRSSSFSNLSFLGITRRFFMREQLYNRSSRQRFNVGRNSKAILRLNDQVAFNVSMQGFFRLRNSFRNGQGNMSPAWVGRITNMNGRL